MPNGRLGRVRRVGVRMRQAVVPTTDTEPHLQPSLRHHSEGVFPRLCRVPVGLGDRRLLDTSVLFQ